MSEERSEKIEGLLNAGLPEIRSMSFSDFEVKNDGWAFRGLANAYDQEADLGDFTEEFRRGAFRKPLANGDNTRLIYDHAPPHLPVLATIKGGTLQMKDDVKGLDVRGEIAQHYVGEAARELIKRGDIQGMSPGFIVGQGNSEISYRSGKPHRAITALQHLTEVSLTTDPAYPGTSAEMRSMWALRMAESLDLSQHTLMGSYGTQLETRATEPAVETACETCGAEPCSCEQVEPDPVEEQRSETDPDDASGVAAKAAARRRRLQMMGLTIPAEFRR